MFTYCQTTLQQYVILMLWEGGSSKSRYCNKIAREIWYWCINKEIWLSAGHIAGSKNTVADML